MLHDNRRSRALLPVYFTVILVIALHMSWICARREISVLFLSGTCISAIKLISFFTWDSLRRQERPILQKILVWVFRQFTISDDYRLSGSNVAVNSLLLFERVGDDVCERLNSQLHCVSNRTYRVVINLVRPSHG